VVADLLAALELPAYENGIIDMGKSDVTNARQPNPRT
jgi:hypothetical protein